MDINELESFKMSDAIKFRDELNPELWINDELDPEVRSQLLLIAQDFVSSLGISDLHVVDVTVSGSNAAYSYTPHSDLDLHVLVDMSKLRDDAIYRELFTAKKTLYNDAHDITIRDIPVELYIQDVNEPVKSLGEYSVLHDKWIRIPKKSKANFDQEATKAKFDNLAEIVDLALKTRDLDRVEKTIDTIKRYRKAGLTRGGEFGPENLAFKAIRKQGGIQDLYDLRNTLRSEKLSIEEQLEEDFVSKQQVINYFVSRGKSAAQGAAAWERGWRGPKPKTAKPYDPTRHANIRSPYVDEDYDPNGPPPGPEFKPTMPAGTVKVDVSDVYDWYKLGQHISNLKGLGKHDFGKGPPSTILSFGDEETEHKYINDLEKTGLSTTDIDPVDPNQPKGMKRQKTDPTFNVNEADDRKAAVLKIQKHLNKKYGANLDLDGKLGPLTLKSINKFMPRAKTGLADEPNKTTAVQGKKLKETENRPTTSLNFRTWVQGGVPKHSFEVIRNGKKIAWGEISKDNEWDDDRGASVQDIVVHPDYRRKGFATKIYNEIERRFNYKLHPSDDVKPDGQEFWKARDNLDEASGYIPSEKEKNDPRFKTALTVDVRPDAIKKNAKAFGFKTSRAGIPPQARPDGKLK